MLRFVLTLSIFVFENDFNRGLKNDLISLNFPFFEVMKLCIHCPNTLNFGLNKTRLKRLSVHKRGAILNYDFNSESIKNKIKND